MRTDGDSRVSEAHDLCEALGRSILSNRETLLGLNEACTGDSRPWIEADAEAALTQLRRFPERAERAFAERLLKPKGKVLLITSYNEPFILGTIPIVAALVAGNRVHVRPSRRSQAFLAALWSDPEVQSLSQRLAFVEGAVETIVAAQADLDALYFFGGERNARPIAALCASRLIEFYPEIEGGDCQVVGRGAFDAQSPAEWAVTTLAEAFGHYGQRCHRLQGCYVPRASLESASLAATSALIETSRLPAFLAPSDRGVLTVGESLERVLRESEGRILLSPNGLLPAVVLSPRADSELVQKALFHPTFWIVPYDDEDEIVTRLKARPYALGLSVRTSDEGFARRIVAETRQARYTINRCHVGTDDDEGWGGVRPSGFGGYRSWIEHFSNAYAVLGPEAVAGIHN